MKKIIILMSTYNGEQYLEEQVQSIINQKFRDGSYRVELFVRDDGSQDGTVRILEKYREKGLLSYYVGQNVGLKKSFWDLLRCAEDADYYAFSDQDDVWFADKLSRAVERLSKEGDIPLLYCSDAVATDKDLHPIEGYEIHAKMLPDFPYTLTEGNIVQGCTCVFNSKARTCMMEYDMKKYPEEFHDALAGKIISLLGRVVYDEAPSMFYRIHGNNAWAKKTSSSSGRKCFIKRIWIFFSYWEREVGSSARVLEEIYRNKIANSEKASCLYEVAHYRESFGTAISFLKDKAFRTGDFKHDFKLFVKIMVGKI